MYAAGPTWRAAGVDLRYRNVNHFVDNTVALSAFVHGYARATDMARLANCMHLSAAGMRTRVWLEYVPSNANLADPPSRGEYELLRTMGGHRVDIPIIGISDWLSPLGNWIEWARDSDE